MEERAAPIADVSGNAWYHVAVQFVTGDGYMNGVGGNQFDPNGQVTRAQMAQILYNFSGKPDVSGLPNPFADVGETWYKAPIVFAKNTGIVNGTGTSTFNPDDLITREQVAVMLMNYTKASGGSSQPGNPLFLWLYRDGNTVSGWAQEAVAWAVQNGVMSGSGGSLNPSGTCTRAELAQFITNTCTSLGKPSAVDVPSVPATPSPSPSVSPSPSPDPSASPSPSPSASPSPSPTPSVSPSPRPSATPEPVIPGTVSGFDRSSYSYADTIKVERSSYFMQANGSMKYTVNFFTDGSASWLEGVDFQVEDVTPPAYKKMFADMGRPSANFQVSVAPYRYKPLSVQGPIVNGNFETAHANAGVTLTITGNQALRALRVTATRDGEQLDVLYALNQSPDRDNADRQLYKEVRQRIEKQIWNDSMSNLEKLKALAKYVGESTRYPRSEAVDKDLNPQYWSDFAVDNQFLYYDQTSDPVLNRCMALQGGIITCQAEDIIVTAGQEDLGLPYLYDGTKVAPGEGVWRVTGSYSTNPGNPWHESASYKDANETQHLLDAQGGYRPDSEYDYSSHILPLNP